MAEVEAMDDVPSDYDAFEIKELLIESAMRSNLNQSMATHLKDEDLQRAISFEPQDLETTDYGAPYYTGVDLYTALQIQGYDLARLQYLNAIGTKLSGNPKVQEQIRDMLDVELKQRHEEKLCEAKSVHQKVPHIRPIANSGLIYNKFVTIASARIKAAMLAPDPRDPIGQKRESFDFVVSLTTLRGGYAGTTQRQRLFFSFPENYHDSKSYIDFLAQLQDATQLCTIPPLEPGEPYRASSGSTGRFLEGYDYDEDNGIPVNALGIMPPTPPDSFTTTPAPLRPKRDVRGYTLDDGPWIYTSKLGFKVLKGKSGAEEGKKLIDKRSYDNMIQMLRSPTTIFLKDRKEKIQTPKPGTLVVDIIHSMDLAAINRHNSELIAVKSEETQFRRDHRAAGFTSEDIGEPYGAFLKRQIADEKEKASRAHHYDKQKARTEEKVRVMAEDMRKQFFGRYSPGFAQKPFELEVESRKELLMKELEGVMKRVPKDTSGF
ncbi:hypothetical protein VTL71DRAFT_4748 [Oculimacula yallundae]|uniref:Uncharacterized protein n=1 Tax=Oculimacula yallundae TaxID=86028 RepID=A0ABR4C2Y5_9HELO